MWRCCSLGHDDKSVHAGAFDLTGKTGSLFYMAPEVANSEPYNEKVAVGPRSALFMAARRPWKTLQVMHRLFEGC